MSSNNPTYDTRRNRLAPTRQRAAMSTFAWIDKNLLNYPVARDTRVKHAWIKHETGRYFTDLGRRITLWFGADGDRRCPNGFDVNLLLLLLGELRRQDKAEITLPSLSAMIRAMGLAPDAANLRRLRASLTLWSTISIQFRNYYVATRRVVNGEVTSGKWMPGKNVDKTLPPPFRAVKLGRPQIRISISETWYKKHKRRKRYGYRERVLLPLPMSAPAQNVVLTTLVSKDGSQKRRRRRYCRKIGVNHAARGRVLQHALATAIAYYSRTGGALKHESDGKFIRFGVAKPQFTPRKPSPLEPKQQPKSKIARLVPKRHREKDQVVGQKPHLEAIGIQPTEPKLIVGKYEADGRSCSWYEQPDGRMTADREGRIPLE
jgi:hypothetical protein